MASDLPGRVPAGYRPVRPCGPTLSGRARRSASVCGRPALANAAPLGRTRVEHPDGVLLPYTDVVSGGSFCQLTRWSAGPASLIQRLISNPEVTSGLIAACCRC